MFISENHRGPALLGVPIFMVQTSCSQFAICEAFWQFVNELLLFF